jgi:CheY-like chemotaxis protein
MLGADTVPQGGLVLTRPPLASAGRHTGGQPAASSRCALVAGADPRIRQLLRTVLEIGGLLVVEAASQGEVVSRLVAPAKPPDVVILDVALPQFSGMATLSFMRRDARLAAVPVVVLTSFADPPEHTRFRQSGAAAVMSKPFRAQRLLETVKSVVSARAH